MLCFNGVFARRARCRKCDCDLSVYDSKTMNWNFWQSTAAAAAENEVVIVEPSNVLSQLKHCNIL